MPRDAGGGGNRRSIATRGRAVGGRKPSPPKKDFKFPKMPKVEVLTPEQKKAWNNAKRMVAGIKRNYRYAEQKFRYGK